MQHRNTHELAYRLWQERGCPEGSPDQDWLAAESRLLKAAAGKPRQESGRRTHSTPLTPQIPRSQGPRSQGR